MANDPNKIFINTFTTEDFKIDYPKSIGQKPVRAKKVRAPVMSVASQLTPLTHDVVLQALEVAYQSAVNNYNKALAFKEQQGENWTVEEEEILQSFESHVNVVITAANELGFKLDV